MHARIERGKGHAHVGGMGSDAGRRGAEYGVHAIEAVRSRRIPHRGITAIVVPRLAFGTASTYRKVRDRASYAFALVSVAAALDIASGQVRDVRLALGGALPALGPLGIGVTTLGELLLQIGQHLLNLGFSISSRSNWEFADNVAVLIRNHGYERKIVIGTLNYLAKVFGHEFSPCISLSI